METNLTELSQTEELKPIMQLVDTIMAIPEEQLNEQNAQLIINAIQIEKEDREKAIKALIDNFKTEGYKREEAISIVENSIEEINKVIDEFHPSHYRRQILEHVFNTVFDLLRTAAEQYHGHDIVLPISLDEGAQMPTYAHPTDAAADLYAKEDIVVKAHSLSNLINTGVHIGLPEGWMAMILPRSSIGAKTGLRLSNSCGIIDSSYRGFLGVLYDNISDSDYEIHAGDRIAQLLIFPSYHFKSMFANTLNETDRGSGGFGSSGK